MMSQCFPQLSLKNNNSALDGLLLAAQANSLKRIIPYSVKSTLAEYRQIALVSKNGAIGYALPDGSHVEFSRWSQHGKASDFVLLFDGTILRKLRGGDCYFIVPEADTMSDIMSDFSEIIDRYERRVEKIKLNADDEIELAKIAQEGDGTGETSVKDGDQYAISLSDIKLKIEKNGLRKAYHDNESRLSDKAWRRLVYAVNKHGASSAARGGLGCEESTRYSITENMLANMQSEIDVAIKKAAKKHVSNNAEITFFNNFGEKVSADCRYEARLSYSTLLSIMNCIDAEGQILQQSKSIGLQAAIYYEPEPEPGPAKETLPESDTEEIEFSLDENTDADMF